jgi:bifunctional non-homologous end joining protein LigD
MAKSEREVRIFIDWSQNAQHKTTVAVYSLRAKRDRPYVSMPVTWRELRAAATARDPARLSFEPKAALSRLARLGDLFRPVLKLRQRLPADVLAGIARQRTA